MTKNIWRVYGRHFFSIFHFVDAVQKLGQSSLSPLYDSEVVPAMSNTLSKYSCFTTVFKFQHLYTRKKLFCGKLCGIISKLVADAFWLCFVSILWGSTNPLIRKGSKGIEDISRSGRIRQFLAEIFFLASNWKVRAIFTAITGLWVKLSYKGSSKNCFFMSTSKRKK